MADERAEDFTGTSDCRHGDRVGLAHLTLPALISTPTFACLLRGGHPDQVSRRGRIRRTLRARVLP